MPKIGMRPLRERQLIAATRGVLRAEGFARTTMLRVAKRAGLSTGTVQHYFTDKEGLLTATLAALNGDLGRSLLSRLRGVETPADRLRAMIDAQFAEDQFTPETVAVWHVLWGNMRELPRLRETTALYVARNRSNVRYAFRFIVPPAHVDDRTDAMLALIDGLWVAAAQARDGPEAARARDIAHRYLENDLSRFSVDPDGARDG